MRQSIIFMEKLLNRSLKMGLFSSNNQKHIFTSESVSEGHPDKVCDQISDAILDACLKLDSDAHVACETFATTNFILIGGEIGFSKNAKENSKWIKKNAEKIVRKVVQDIGYTNTEFGLDYKKFKFVNKLHSQSQDINQGVVGAGLAEYKGQQGAGDQGMMFGFACNETQELMPAPVIFSHKILLTASVLRKSGEIKWLRPDAKSQVTVEYEDNHPSRIDAVVVSHQHAPDVSIEEIRDTIINKIIKPVLEPTGLLDENTKYYINPTGRFVTGGPDGDAGLTGRKIIVDTYGGMGRHGGGAFSGKDPTKVDRSAAYAARHVAKNIVAAGLAKRCEVEIAYAIGIARPVSVMVDTFGTGVLADDVLADIVNEVFDLRPAAIIDYYELRKPIYRQLASYGHVGREDLSVKWEVLDKVEILKKKAGI